MVSGSDIICFLEPAATPIQIIPGPLQQYQVSTFFSNTNPSTIYTASVAGGSTIYPEFPYTFTDTDFEQYDIITLQATSSNVANCQTSVQALYASCSVNTTILAPSEVVPDEQSYNIATWFTPANNSNIGYFITNPAGVVEGPITSYEAANYIFTGNAGDMYTVQAKDLVITNYGLSCIATVNVMVNSGCPIAVYTNGNSYRYNDSRFPVFGEGSSQTSYTIAYTDNPLAAGALSLPIKTLFQSGPSDPSTRYEIKLAFPQGGAFDLSQYDTYINPGTDPSPQPVEGLITGNEVFKLIYNTTGTPYWSWEITGGDFASGDQWSIYQYIDDPYLVDALYISIRAYSTNLLYELPCEQTVLIKPPLASGIPTCDYYCVANPGGGYTVVGAPTNDATTCLIDSTYCDSLTQQ